MAGKSIHTATRLYLEMLRHNQAGDSVRKQAASVCNRLCARYRRRQFAGITSPDLKDFLYGPHGISVGMAGITQTGHRTVLRKFFTHGYEAGWRKDLLPIPGPSVSSTKASGPVTPTLRLTVDELFLLLERSPHPMLRGMLAVAMNTALRVSDVRKIQIRDLTSTGLAVVILKTGRHDLIPATLDLDEEMHRYLTWYTDTLGVTLRDSDAYLFPGFVQERGRVCYDRVQSPDHPIGYDWARRRLSALYEACGLDVEPGDSWHTIRRSVARIYFDGLRGEISRDHALRQTAALLGHRSTMTTEVYLGVEAEKEARDESLRGKRFLIPSGNVTPLRRPNAS